MYVTYDKHLPTHHCVIRIVNEIRALPMSPMQLSLKAFQRNDPEARDIPYDTLSIPFSKDAPGAFPFDRSGCFPCRMLQEPS